MELAHHLPPVDLYLEYLDPRPEEQTEEVEHLVEGQLAEAQHLPEHQICPAHPLVHPQDPSEDRPSEDLLEDLLDPEE